jgi:uncharacterized protein (TIGR03437 family)
MTIQRLARWTLLVAFSVGCTFGMPILRLETSVVGPVEIAVGVDGPDQVIEAYNVGTGQLDLTLSTPASWLAPAVGDAVPCTHRDGICLPITMVLNTAALERGTYTGIITITDPGAADTPQTIAVTVHMGGAVPDSADFLLPPNESTTALFFQTRNELETEVDTDSGGEWLSLVLDNHGSFPNLYPYQLRVRHLEGQTEGTYSGTVSVSGSDFPPDNKDVPVSLQITSEPIATLPSRVVLRAPAGTFEPQYTLSPGSRGLGDLAITQFQVSTQDGGNWLTAVRLEGLNDELLLSADTSGLLPGTYSGTLTLETNAINGPHQVPVELELLPQSGPAAEFEGVVNNNGWDTPVARGGIASVYGEQFSYEDSQQGSELPLVRSLGGVQLFVNGIDAPLFYTSYRQVNFQMPFEIEPGTATVQLYRDGQPGNTVTVEVAERAPRLLDHSVPSGFSGYAIVTLPDNSLVGIPDRRARVGDVLVIWAIGLGPTTPAVATGEPAPVQEPLARVEPAPQVVFGNEYTGVVSVAPIYAGLAGGSVGLYQVNVVVPESVPLGNWVWLHLEDEGVISNSVGIAIE